MGACGCRKRPVPATSPDMEEALIEPFELSLGFANHTVTDLVKGLFSLSVHGEISEQRLRTFLESFGAVKDGFNDPSKPLGRLYAEFKGQTGYLPEKLGLLMALLGKGEDVPRAEALFLCYDLDHNEFLSQVEMTELMNTLADLALFQLPNYAVDCLALKKDTESAQKLEGYVKQLGQKQSEAVAAWVQLLMERKTNVTALKFSATFAHLGKPLCSASGLRRFALSPSQSPKQDEDSSYGM